MTNRILVVDPHAGVADLLRLTLEVEGYEVETACSTASAMLYAERHELSAALVNLGLPDGDGLLLLRLLKSRDPSLEVILMTGSSPSSAKVSEATEQGTFQVLFKPFDLDEMLALVGKALERRRFLRRL